MITRQQLVECIKALMRAKAKGAKLNGNSVFEKLIQRWINIPRDILLVYDWDPKPAEPAPPVYEDVYNLGKTIVNA